MTRTLQSEKVQQKPIYRDSSYDVFLPIAKYFAAGDVESLSAWFAPSLEMSIIQSSENTSKNQARQVLKTFFNRHSPRAFEIMHQAGRENMKYVLGDLTAGGEHFSVTIFVCTGPDGKFQIQQIKIDRPE